MKDRYMPSGIVAKASLAWMSSLMNPTTNVTSNKTKYVACRTLSMGLARIGR